MNLIGSAAPRQCGWRRVDRVHACPICGKDHWCLVAEDDSAVICPRVAEGAVKRLASGWLHRLRDRDDWRTRRSRTLTARIAVPGEAAAHMGVLAERFRAAVDTRRLDRLAEGLGVSAASLRRLHIGWCETSRAWSFPMRDAEGRVLGIRLRTEVGKKFAVRGSRDALLMPDGLGTPGLLLIAEGPTDTAALLDLGFAAVGRPSCTGGRHLLVNLVRRLRPAEVVIVADRDVPGQDGALDLVQRLVIHARRLKLITPHLSCKDARAWVKAGATPEDFRHEIEAAEVHRVFVRVHAAPAADRARQVRHGH